MGSCKQKSLYGNCKKKKSKKVKEQEKIEAIKFFRDMNFKQEQPLNNLFGGTRKRRF